MKKRQVILDNYLHGHQKFLMFYFLIICFLGGVNFILHPNDLTDSLIGVILLIISYIAFVAMIGKKGLCISDNKFYRGIAIGDKFFLKEKIDIAKFSEFVPRYKEKSSLPGFLEYSGAGLFNNYHECSVYLTRPDSGKRKILISMSESEMNYDVRSFLHKWTNLKESNDKIKVKSGL